MKSRYIENRSLISASISPAFLAVVLFAAPALCQDAGTYECEESDGSEYTYQSPDDWDGDGYLDSQDSCPFTEDHYVAESEDEELKDQLRDVDGDGVWDSCDNCPTQWNEEQTDLDSDTVGDVCDNDADNDGVLNVHDNCYVGDETVTKTVPVDVHNPSVDLDGDGIVDGQPDMDEDGIGDACDPDVDGDGLDNDVDTCPLNAANDGTDCNRDTDGDGVEDWEITATGAVPLDNCIGMANEDQNDIDEDGAGDLCDPDMDGDEVWNELDNCPVDANPDQSDRDRDSLGDVCDTDECFAIDGNVDECLELGSDKAFQIYSPDLLSVTTGDEVLLRLYANREDAEITYKWTLKDGPDFSGGIENPEGLVSCSTPYEYHYPAGAEPTFSPDVAGDYEIVLSVSTSAGESAERTIILQAYGSDYSGSSACTCTLVGAPNTALGLPVILLLLGAVLVVRRRRRD